MLLWDAHRYRRLHAHQCSVWGCVRVTSLAELRLRSIAQTWLRWLVELPRYPKRAILASIDFLLFSLSLWLALSLRLNEFYLPPSRLLALVQLTAPIIGVATFFRLGLYRLVTRFIGYGSFLIPIAVGLSALLWAFVVLVSGVQFTPRPPGIAPPIINVVPRSVLFIYPVIATLLTWSFRQLAGWMLKSVHINIPAIVRETKSKKVLIYGANKNGVELREALRRSGQYEPVGFVDMNPTLWRQYVAGLRVYQPSRLPSVVQWHGVHEVLLAMPKADRSQRLAALRQLEPLMVKVRTLPAIEDLAAGRVAVSDLRPIAAEDLLGRDSIPANADLLERNIRGKSVLITGAGGSIGSELVREVLRQEPRRLVMLDASETRLYEIGLEVEELLQNMAQAPQRLASMSPDLVPVLGSIQNSALLRQIIEANAVETIYHAAAYKHVPIVERNPVVGLRNNAFGTATLAEVAELCAVKHFVLVSTDKAVRPTSIMGASKRLAEMMLQARLHSGSSTTFTIVRFGNVLDSSGSVVPRFRRQIEAGGPVTVTHPEAVRYFMSIREAAALVIQAGAMSKGGDVFVLDMGEPIKIDDLARSMIRLAGLEVRDASNPGGEIAIDYIGLRKGEKLHEELMLGSSPTATEHPRIFKVHEPFLPMKQLTAVMAELRAAMDANDVARIRDVLAGAVESHDSLPCPSPSRIMNASPAAAASITYAAKQYRRS